MELRKFIATTIRKYLNEQVSSKEYIYNIAKNTDYDSFLEKIDEIVGGEVNQKAQYNILYKGMSEGDELSDIWKSVN